MRSLLAGLFFGVLGFAGFALATSGWIILAVVPLIALWGIAAPAMQSLMARHGYYGLASAGASGPDLWAVRL